MTRHKFPPLPGRDRLRAARALHSWLGWNTRQLRDAGFKYSLRELEAPEYDPIDDPVAIERAMAGDRDVWESLTLYERHTLRDLWADRIDAMDRDYANASTGVHEWARHVTDDPEWLASRIRNYANKRLHRRLRAQA